LLRPFTQPASLILTMNSHPPGNCSNFSPSRRPFTPTGNVVTPIICRAACAYRSQHVTCILKRSNSAVRLSTLGLFCLCQKRDSRRAPCQHNGLNSCDAFD
jgi:hypothetical protein